MNILPKTNKINLKMIKILIISNSNKNNNKQQTFNKIYIKNLQAKKHKTPILINFIIVKDNKKNSIFEI